MTWKWLKYYIGNFNKRKIFTRDSLNSVSNVSQYKIKEIEKIIKNNSHIKQIFIYDDDNINLELKSNATELLLIYE